MTQREKHLQALNSFTEQVKDDSNVIALLLSGSLSYGTVWEKSDIDLTMIVRDGSVSKSMEYCVDEDGVEMHVYPIEVAGFKNTMQKLRGGEYPHSYFGNGTMVFSKDESLTMFFEDARKVGRDDAVLSFINMCGYLLGNMEKAEKWITVFNDPLYAQRFLHNCCLTVADMELLLHHEEPTRESILRAQELNPMLMREVYEIPSTTAMTVDEVRHTLKVLDDYLMKHIEVWGTPVLKFLADGDVKSFSQINRALPTGEVPLDYMAEKGIIEKVTQPFRIFRKSKLQLEEAAYFYIQDAGKHPQDIFLIKSCCMASKDRYMAALEGFTNHVKNDPNVIALILYGSLSYGTVWEKSDLDLDMLVRDGSMGKSSATYCIDVDGIFAHIDITEVSAFKRSMEKIRGGEFSHSVMSKGRICFTKDESLLAFFEDVKKLGKDDAVIAYIMRMEWLLVEMNRAEKWITVFHDTLYSQRFLQRCCIFAADMLLLLHGEEPTRESILRAMELNPALMKEVYVVPSTAAMSEDAIRHTLQVLHDFIMEHIQTWSKPILRYFSDGEVKTQSECDKFFRFEMTVALAYLASKGILARVTQPSRVFRHSKLTVEEVSYFYIKEENKNV